MASVTRESAPRARRDIEGRYRRVRNVAILMDAAVRVPGTRFRIGLGSLIGLPPGAGDAFMTAVSLWIVWQGKQLGLPRNKIARMLGNVAVEAALGSVPMVGDVMDMVWKANMRNLAIIDAHLAVRSLNRSAGQALRHTGETL